MRCCSLVRYLLSNWASCNSASYLARQDTRAQLLMSTPGVGVLVCAHLRSSDRRSHARFRSSNAVGAHFGLTPKKYQSGETDITGRISKVGDAGVRTALYEAANVILIRPVKGSSSKSWAMRVAKRAGMSKAKVALARQLAVILHRMLPTGRGSSPTRRRLPCRHTGKERSRVRATRGTSRPEQVPSPGRWIRSGRSAASGSYKDCASLDWPADPHQTPSGGSPTLTPDRSKTPAAGCSKGD
jgi:Transposase IS116/IS110/IS902 family